MNISAPFIRRPVATTLLTLGVLLAGAVGFRMLPVAPLPQVDFPTIMVQANLPGASPETMAATVATPLERALGHIAGLSEITSSSALGSTRVVLQFDLSRDIDGAAREVQAAINAAASTLPTGLPSNPTYRKVNPADQPVMVLSLSSTTLTRAQVYDAATNVMAQRIAQVSGVGQVSVSGGALPAVRVRLDLDALNHAGIALEQVRKAIAAVNANAPKGMVEDDQHNWLIATNDHASTAKEYASIIVAWSKATGAAIRLADVAEVTDSVQDVRQIGLTNGQPTTQVLIFKQPGANIIETVDGVRALLPQIRAALPADIHVRTSVERTATIRASLHEVERSLVLSVVLVILVVFAFLRDARSTLIPAVAVPVSLVGTFAAMYLLGYSLDNLSLMALTVATGFVVDDAIVVLENIVRHIERGATPMQAALAGSREVGFTVLAMSLSLIAVFVPILAMGGIVGRYFREFAATLSISILISLLVSLTTAPMLCALVLRERRAAPQPLRAGPVRWPERLRGWAAGRFERVSSAYQQSLEWVLDHSRFMVLVFFLTMAATIAMYVVVPKGFFPVQDVGLLVGGIQLDQSASFAMLSRKLTTVSDIVKADPAVDTVLLFNGGPRSTGGSMFVSLKPIKDRRVSADVVINRLRPKLSKIAGTNVYLQAAGDIRVGGRQSDATYQYTLQSDDLAELRSWEPKIRKLMSALPELADVNTDAQDHGQQILLTMDRDKLSRLGFDVQDVDNVLNNSFGQRQVSTIYAPLNQYTVVMEAALPFLQGPQALSDAFLINSQGHSVPLSSVARWEVSNAPLSVNHQGGFASSTVSFNLAPGVSLGQATQAIQNAFVRAGVPTSIQGSFAGNAKVFQDSLSSQPYLIVAALLTIYIVLGILYENTVHPITILSTLPSAGLGALLALFVTGTDFSIIALIGVILLIGIVKKNAILMIDFAVEAQGKGLDPRAAIRDAGVQRLRPILMTTFAAMLGAMPLALGAGDGAELRQPLGITVVGGLLVSQVLTLYTTPVIYLALDRWRLAWHRRWEAWRGSRRGSDLGVTG